MFLSAVVVMDVLAMLTVISVVLADNMAKTRMREEIWIECGPRESRGSCCVVL